MSKIIYMFFVLGVILINYNYIYYCVNCIRNRFKLRHNFREISKIEQKAVYKGIFKEIDQLLLATGLSSRINKPSEFIFISVLFSMCGFIACFFISGIKLGIVTGVFTLFLPLMASYMKLNNKRVFSSKEGDILIQELLVNYKVYDFNMKEAIEKTCNGLDNAPNSRGVLIKLLNRLNNAFTKKEVEEALDIFKYTLGTTWASALASDIYFAEIHGIKVTESLEDLAKSITKSKEVIENSQREHNEARLILKYLAPIAYVLSILCACNFFEFSLAKFIRYQFMTPLGLQWVVIMALIYGASIIINSLLTNERMDI